MQRNAADGLFTKPSKLEIPADGGVPQGEEGIPARLWRHPENESPLGRPLLGFGPRIFFSHRHTHGSRTAGIGFPTERAIFPFGLFPLTTGRALANERGSAMGANGHIFTDRGPADLANLPRVLFPKIKDPKELIDGGDPLVDFLDPIIIHVSHARLQSSLEDRVFRGIIGDEVANHRIDHQNLKDRDSPPVTRSIANGAPLSSVEKGKGRRIFSPDPDFSGFLRRQGGA